MMIKRQYLRQPIKHVNLEQIKNIGELVQAFHSSSFQSRNLAKCFDVYKNMLQDEDVVIFMGLSGAVVPGGMRKVVRDMIEFNLIDVLVSTGASLYHDFFEALGKHHYVGFENVDDVELDTLNIDRIYDTFADDLELEKVDLILSKIADELGGKECSSREFMEFLGSRLDDEVSILYAAHKRGVPIFCPALSDSGIGIGLTEHYSKNDGEKRLNINQIIDNFEIMQIKRKASSTGAIFIGGGVPKNYIQQIEPMNEVLGGKRRGGHKYAIQITMADPKWGGLSGCTLSEAKSWGKIDKRALHATVYVDATIGMPLLVGSILQNNEDVVKNRKRRKFYWNDDKLERLEYE